MTHEQTQLMELAPPGNGRPQWLLRSSRPPVSMRFDRRALAVGLVIVVLLLIIGAYTLTAGASRTPLADVVQALLDGEVQLDELALDTDMRWEFLISLAAGGRADASIIEAALALDNTQNGQLAAATAHAAIPTAEGKAGTWESVVVRGERANAVQRAAIDGFTKVWDTSLLEPYVAKYFAAIQDLWESKSYETASSMITGLYPSQLVSQATLDATDAFLDALSPDVPALRRLLTESRDTVVRALRAQAADA